MSLFEKWDELASKERTQEEYNEFWENYLKKEMDIYDDILINNRNTISGTVKELGDEYGLTSEEVMGFLQGINTSLKEPLTLEEVEEDSEIVLNIDYEKLYYNMIDAKADWLYNLKSWDGILPEERRHEIRKQYNIDHTAVNENKIGRNEPCPCGSGKKYKKCCGKNA